MLHFVKNEKEEPTLWRDPEDIHGEMRELARRMTAVHTCYTALETACRTLGEAREHEEVRTLLDTLLGEARVTLEEIDVACERMNELNREMRETRCLLCKLG